MPSTSFPSASFTDLALALGIPMPVVTSTEYPSLISTRLIRQMRSPASVSIRNSSPSFALIIALIHAATQRVPFPLISATDPSALCRRMRPDFAPVQKKNSTPSAPTPVFRAHRGRVRSAQSRPEAALSVTIEKIVATCVSFGKGNQSSSGSRKFRSASIPGSERSLPSQSLVLLLSRNNGEGHALQVADPACGEIRHLLTGLVHRIEN